MSGPLAGIKIVEISATGPVALFGQMMADLGATILRVDRPSGMEGRKEGIHADNRAVVECDLKNPQVVSWILDLVRSADVIVEGYRPGVMERLGLGPDVCLKANPKVVFARCTGWGQTGPLAQEPGHDLNYLALTGALAAIGPEEEPVVPINYVADYGGGAMLLAVGVLAAVISARTTGRGQVIDNAMVDGVGVLDSILYELFNSGRWQNRRASNFLDGAAPYYRCYKCADGKWVAVGSLEMKFRQALAGVLGVTALGAASSNDPQNWPAITAEVAAVFATATRDEWMKRMIGKETCCTPVLDLTEAPHHPHNLARNSFIRAPAGGWTPAPAPRLSSTPAERHTAPKVDDVLAAFGMAKERLAAIA